MLQYYIQASRNSPTRLTGPAYVWILPLFYDPDWWRVSEQDISQLRPSQRCSNYEMEEILNTTHVLSVGLHHHQFPTLDAGWNQTVAIVRYYAIYNYIIGFVSRCAYTMHVLHHQHTFSKFRDSLPTFRLRGIQTVFALRVSVFWELHSMDLLIL